MLKTLHSIVWRHLLDHFCLLRFLMSSQGTNETAMGSFNETSNRSLGPITQLTHHWGHGKLTAKLLAFMCTNSADLAYTWQCCMLHNSV